MRGLIHRARPRRGIALVTVLLALLLIGAIVAGALHIVVRDQRSSREMLVESRALAAAQNALAVAVASLGGKAARGLAIGEERLLRHGRAPGLPSSGGVAFDSVAVVRLTSRTWLLTAVGYVESSRARRQLAALVELRQANVNPAGALTVVGAATVSATAQIDGAPGAGLDSSCAGDSIPEAGLVVTARSRIRAEPCPSGNCIRGAPPVLETGPESPFAAALSPADFAELTTWANGSTIVYVRGDMRRDAGLGEGILLVGGDLELGGDAQFRGIIVVRGALRTTGRPRVEGAILVGDASRTSTIAGSPRISYSRCAVTSALETASRLSRVADRSWAEIF